MEANKKPKVSVIMPSYNHQKFVKAAVESILTQTFQDFEIIIADDGSKDNSVEVIKTIKDDRISFYPFEKNMGAVYATNFCIEKAGGEYIALLNSDDMWEVNKLEKQIKLLDEDKTLGAVFSRVEFVDEQELPLKDYQWGEVFNQENRSSGMWLRRFFYEFNCICHPSMLIRRELYDKTGLYNPSFRQLPDFAMWVKLLRYTKIHIMEDKLVKFRILDKDGNASSDTRENRARSRNELLLILRDFFLEMTLGDFKAGFADKLINKDISTEEEMLCEQAFVYLGIKNDIEYIYKLIGIEKMHALLTDKGTRELLREKYNFTEHDFYKITANLYIEDYTNKNFKEIVAGGMKKDLDNSSFVFRALRKIYRALK